MMRFLLAILGILLLLPGLCGFFTLGVVTSGGSGGYNSAVMGIAIVSVIIGIGGIALLAKVVNWNS